MTSFVHRTALAALFALTAGSAGAAVTVAYIQPEKFSDLPLIPWDRDDTLKALGEHFTQLGEDLPPGQDLRIEVLDIDLAGRAIPSARAGGHDIRVVRGQADSPRIRLRYVLEQNGQVIKRGEEELSDMNYLRGRVNYADTEPLGYEKQMVDNWFDKNIAPLPGNRR